MTQFKNLKGIELGSIVTFKVGQDKESIEMIVTGIISSLHSPNKVTLYLDFEDNQGDIWEVEIEDILSVRNPNTNLKQTY